MTDSGQHIPEDSRDKFVAGNTAIIADTVTNPDGTSKDLTGATVRFALAEYPGAPPEVQKDSTTSDVTITDATNGELEITLHPEDTEGLGDAETEAYHYEIEVEDQNGHVSTVTTGQFHITASSV